MSEPQEHISWSAFWEWAGENGCQSEYEEDWLPSWECWLAGWNHRAHLEEV